MENNVLQQLKENIAKVMIGNERTIELVLTCLVAKGPVSYTHLTLPTIA